MMEKKKPMIAEHNGVTYVASESLSERLDRSENEMRRLRHVLYLVLFLVLLSSFAIFLYASIKRELIISLLLALLKW